MRFDELWKEWEQAFPWETTEKHYLGSLREVFHYTFPEEVTVCFYPKAMTFQMWKGPNGTATDWVGFSKTLNPSTKAFDALHYILDIVQQDAQRGRLSSEHLGPVLDTIGKLSELAKS